MLDTITTFATRLFERALLVLIGGMCAVPVAGAQEMDPASVPESWTQEALQNGHLAREGFVRSHRYMTAWLEQSDPETGLIPRNLDEDTDIWNAKDAAADNYPFMVLTAALTDRERFAGRMRDMLDTETRLTSRLGALPDTYSFSKDDFIHEDPALERMIFGASEYIKDGLLPLTEWIGPSPWSERMIGMLDEIWRRAPVETPYGSIPSTSHEINGEMLQVLSRVYWMTGDEQYLDDAIRLGDYYLLGDHHPTRNAETLRLRDHGSEVLSGLTELYATVHFARPTKKAAYREPLYAMLDRVLAVGRNEHGLLYNEIDPQTGDVIEPGAADTWGYVLNGYYAVYQIDSTAAYRDAVRQALDALDTHYENYVWEGGSADGDADAIEGALNLYNRAPQAPAARWIDRQTQHMWSKQDSSHLSGDRRWRGTGVIEGWHGDGNFARTSLMYSLWKAQGLTVQPWRQDVVLGAVQKDSLLVIGMKADEAWTGTLIFDRPRHEADLHLPLDWARINQFPEWFTAKPERRYAIQDLETGAQEIRTGAVLQEGVPVRLQPGAEKYFVVRVQE